MNKFYEDLFHVIQKLELEKENESSPTSRRQLKRTISLLKSSYENMSNKIDFSIFSNDITTLICYFVDRKWDDSISIILLNTINKYQKIRDDLLLNQVSKLILIIEYEIRDQNFESRALTILKAIQNNVSNKNNCIDFSAILGGFYREEYMLFPMTLSNEINYIITEYEKIIKFDNKIIKYSQITK